MELFVLADDSRRYELRVDLPKDTADEERDTAVFAAARNGSGSGCRGTRAAKEEPSRTTR